MRQADPETLGPIRKEGEEVPGTYDKYDCEEASKLSRLAPLQPGKTKAHTEVQFLRDAPLTATLHYLKAHMLSPIKCKAADMPNGSAFDNFPQVLYTAHAVYCAQEGLPRSSDKARQLLLYFFFGQFPWETKVYKKGKAQETVLRDKPLVFFLHKRLASGRSRFAKNIEKYFAGFIAAYRDNAGSWEKFLQDKGEGSPPMKFLILIEEGLRMAAQDIYTMGTRALRCVVDLSATFACHLHINLTLHTGVRRFGDVSTAGEKSRCISHLAVFFSNTRKSTDSGIVSCSRTTSSDKRSLKHFGKDICHYQMGKMNSISKVNTSLIGIATPLLRLR